MSKTSITHQDFFVIRTPRLPIEQLLTLGQTKQQTIQAFTNWLAKPEIKEALYLASPSLFERIEQFERRLQARAPSQADHNEDMPSATEKQKKLTAKQEKKLTQTLLKYMIRMCSRPTPFGLFSGINMGEIGSKTQLLSDELSADQRKTRLDMFYLSAIREYFLKHDTRSEKLKYYPNSSHYFIAEYCRYIEAYQSNKTRQYRLSAIESDEHFCFMLEQAKNGKSFSQLVNAFLQYFFQSTNSNSTSNTNNAAIQYNSEKKAEVEDYLRQLIDESILLADIPLPLTGESPDKMLVDSLNKIGQRTTADHLATVLFKLQQLDKKNGAEVADYKRILAHLNELPIKTQENKLFQTDVYRSFSQCQLDKNQIPKLLKQLKLLKGLSAQRGNIFSKFIKQFNQRFEGQFVPLDKLLDEESGISFSNETGYEAPLLAGLQLRSYGSGNRQASTPSKLDNIITQAISLPENRHKSVIKLKSKTLAKHLSKSVDDSDFPASFAAMISLFEEHSDIDRSGKKKQLLVKFNGCYGPSAANLLGRFCHLDKNLKNNVIKHLNNESGHSADVIFAEIIHLPEGRPGNVIARPHLRQYEIVFLADSSLASEFQIPISDLYVWVETNQIKLWSKRLEKQIIPRLSSAHNYSSRSLSAYKFLSMLQHQGATAPEFALPASQASASFVPRIMLDDLILSVKTWRIPRKALAELLINDEIDSDKWQKLKNKYQLDVQLCYAFSDNVLQLNLTNPMMLAVLLVETKGQFQIELKEALTAQYSTPVKAADGQSYANELIIPFFNTGAKVHQHFNDDPQANIAVKTIKRRFSPGSQWLSLKIYSGNAAVDTLLAERLLPFINQCQPLYKKWFFIRYADPEWHLRLRFYGEPSVIWGQLLPKLNQLLDPMVEQGEIHKTELFTYEREVERYGGPDSMALVESLFMADSRLIASTVRLETEMVQDLRWRIALLMTDKLLFSFNYSADDKLKLITQLRTGFGNEFNESSHLRKQLGDKFRSIQSRLKADFLCYANQDQNQSINSDKEQHAIDDETQQVLNLINRWYQEISPVIKNFNQLMNEGEGIKCSKDTLLSSLLHMHNNRMFKAYGREHELLMHDFLRRYYYSQSKISQRKLSPNNRLVSKIT
ncbi:lantibiotic dehydratase [Colwelliaceae bacterium 6441]